MRITAGGLDEAYMNAIGANDTVVANNMTRNHPRDYTSVNGYGGYDFDRDWINERIRDWHLAHQDDSNYRIMTLEQTVRALEDRIRTLEGMVIGLDGELRTKMKELEESAGFSYVKLGNDR